MPTLVIYCWITNYHDLVAQNNPRVLSHSSCAQGPGHNSATSSILASLAKLQWRFWPGLGSLRGSNQGRTAFQVCMHFSRFGSLQAVRPRVSGPCWLSVSCLRGLFTWQLMKIRASKGVNRDSVTARQKPKPYVTWKRHLTTFAKFSWWETDHHSCLREEDHTRPWISGSRDWGPPRTHDTYQKEHYSCHNEGPISHPLSPPLIK